MHVVSLLPGTRRTAMLVLGVLVAVGPLLLGARPARAATTFSVNRTTDARDRNPGNGACDVDPAPGAQCTLRAAIQEANASAAADTIAFAIPGPGVHTIRPTSELPTITRTVTIDGYTQPGASPNTARTGTNAQLRIVLDGSGVGRHVHNRLHILGADDTIIRGLVINGFDHGLDIRGTSVSLVTGVKVIGNFIGTNPAGTATRGNYTGVFVYRAANVVVGGAATADRNLISGNEIGVIFISSSGADTGNAVQGNLIGTAADGRTTLGNGSGVSLSGGRNTTVGGATAAAGNTIAYNGFGVTMTGHGGSGNPSTGNRVLSNAIFANSRLGIDLHSDGPTPNDPGDTDGGVNRRQNFPIVASATTEGSTTTIEGSLNSTPNASFLIQVFSDPAGDEGKVFRGETRVQTNASGNATFAVWSDQVIPASHNVTTTATGDDGTSEFSPPVPAT